MTRYYKIPSSHNNIQNVLFSVKMTRKINVLNSNYTAVLFGQALSLFQQTQDSEPMLV